MAKSTTKDRIANGEAYEALASLEAWAIDTIDGKVHLDASEGERLARELVEKVKKWREGAN
jgi:hypothetical protein